MKWRWKYKILKGLSYLLCSLSYERILSIGKFIGPFILNHIEKQKKRGISQIMTGMEYEQKEAEALLQKVYENIGMTVMELSLIHISEPTRREWLSRMPSSA